LVKRPLVWILGAYLLGLGLAWQQLSIGLVITSAFLGFLMILHYQTHRKERLAQRKEYLFLVLPIFLILGFVVMENQLQLPKIYHAFDQVVPCELTGTVNMIVIKQKVQALYVENNAISLSGGDSYPCENVIVYTSKDHIYQIGNHITAKGSLQKFKKASNPGQFNEELYYKIENIDFKLMADRILIIDSKSSVYHTCLDYMKNRLISVYQDILGDREAGTMIAMLLGEKNMLEDDVKRLYQENGITHILAISGLHISLIGMSIFWLLRKCKLTIITATVITIFFIYSYGELTNFSVSTNRAVVMMVILLCAVIFGKTYDMLSAAALSAMIILIQNPLQLMSAGFLLSFLAVIGIAVLLPALKQLFPGKNAIKDSFFISVSAMIATTPIVLYFFYQFPLYGIITNLIILPFITILTLSSLMAGILGMLSVRLGIFAIGGANYILKLYDLVCEGIRHLPYHMINIGKPKIIFILLSYSLVLVFVFISRKYPKKSLILVLILSQIILFLPSSDRDLRITLLDVGQGDAIFMESGEGTSFLIDGGSADEGKVGTYRIAPFLKSQGIHKLDYVIITHSDQDHINGLTELISEELFPIRCLVMPELSHKDEAYLNLEALAIEKRIPVQYIKAGDYIKEGQLEIFCLNPASDDINITSNAGSTVLSVSYGDFDMLLTGDLEAEGERLLLQRLKDKTYSREWGIHPVTDYDVLKVAHHGSKFSTSEELLNLIRPEYALISCGENNWYGHPHPELLERLTDSGCKTWITYDTGAMTIRTDGKKLTLSSYLEGR
jgi:competence protein ComEC